MALILPPLCFLYYYVYKNDKNKHTLCSKFVRLINVDIKVLDCSEPYMYCILSAIYRYLFHLYRYLKLHFLYLPFFRLVL